MAFDQTTRNRLQRLVSDCRRLLSDEFRIQIQEVYGLDPKSGDVTPMERLEHLNDRERQTAQLLRDILDHYTAADADTDANRQAAIDRIIREQAFTVLNRLVAVLMMEARGLLLPTVSKGQQSQGFRALQVRGRHRPRRDRRYLPELPVQRVRRACPRAAGSLRPLLSRRADSSRASPRCCSACADQRSPRSSPLWAEDETIGWIYQYFNSKEERKAMRDASQAPRNSRELAVRNQFFTPRYVVEFLVDNTLGRLWFNATGGKSALAGRCQYLLVKPDEQPEAATTPA